MYFALLTFVIYLLQLTRDIYSGDIGDLVTSACIGGVPHPPGYPLFSLVGHMLCKLSFFHSPVTQVALISAMASAVGVYIFYRFALRVTKSRYLSVLSASILAFSYLFWLHAEIPEVFGLHNFFVITLLYFAYDYYEKPAAPKLYRLAALTGLALTHHQTILFIGPSLALLVLCKWQILWERKRTIFYALGLAIVAFLLPYLYVFIASSHESVINWDSVTNVSSFIHLVTRKSYGGFAPSVKNGIPVAVKTAVIHDYFKTLVSNFSYQGILLAVLGAIQLIRRRHWIISLSLIGGFILTGPLFVGYAATYYTTTTAFGIIERFYNTSFIVLVFFIPFGFLFLNEMLIKVLKNQTLRLLLISYFMIVPILMFVYNRPKTDLSKTQIGNTFAFDMLDNLPKNAVLFVSGDTTTFNIWYAHFVLGRRRDVDIINPPGVGNNVFLNDELTKLHAKKKSIKLSSLMSETIDDLYKRRPMFATYEIPNKPTHTLLLPRGLVYQVIGDEAAPSEQDYIKLVTEDVRKLHRTRRQALTLAEQNLVATEIPLIYANGHVRIGDFLDTHYKDPRAAEQFYRLALWRDEENSGAYAGLALSLYKGYNDCTAALYNINQAIDIYPVWNTFYVQRYIIASRCKTSTATLRQYRSDYQKRFQKNIDEVLQKQYRLTL
ncbi:DUF2723 domain-containing protein [Candidatus Microgenomates bacterium]|nr:DUF2723 domain-containing protein [Candidatus Microgenomates bacterium]